MKAFITDHQKNFLIEYIIANYETHATQKNEGELFFGALTKANRLDLSGKKTIIPFKNILLPNGIEASKVNQVQKLALVGLLNCDAWALRRFLKEFENSNLMPRREDIIIVEQECSPDKYCFCASLGTNHMADCDLYIQEEATGYSIFSQSDKGTSLLKKIGFKDSNRAPKIRSIEEEEMLDLPELRKAIEDREPHEEFWKGISSNCFGCGACTAVCPLCFCTRQDFENNPDGSCRQCLAWDSCFAKRFSEIQAHHDLRPENVDRLYNWYHHKFVRGYFENKHSLCTGCGRCIEACPANLNMKNILVSLLNRNEKINN